MTLRGWLLIKTNLLKGLEGTTLKRLKREALANLGSDNFVSTL
jgi:hypothetical protein